MTSVTFFEKGKKLCGFKIEGHSSESEKDLEGKIVCSAVSSAAYMAANTVISCIGDLCDTDIDEALMMFTVNNPSDATETVLNGLKLHLTELAKQYSKRLKIITEV